MQKKWITVVRKSPVFQPKADKYKLHLSLNIEDLRNRHWNYTRNSFNDEILAKQSYCLLIQLNQPSLQAAAFAES